MLQRKLCKLMPKLKQAYLSQCMYRDVDHEVVVPRAARLAIKN
jgi:hypothetical protein